MLIKSEPQKILRPAAHVYSLVSDMRNFKPLMPGQVEDFSASSDQCKFSIPGMGEIELFVTDRVQDEAITYSSGGNLPVKFSLILKLDGQIDFCTANFILNADMNPMMAMLAKTPLQNFINLLSQKLKEYAEGSTANA
ncbi:MAG TPA: hypothetical protein VLH16_07620 [Bacteroidales bacterium]|nr:hypothetical protein [Bacteroidales bacterium]